MCTVLEDIYTVSQHNHKPQTDILYIVLSISCIFSSTKLLKPKAPHNDSKNMFEFLSYFTSGQLAALTGIYGLSILCVVVLYKVLISQQKQLNTQEASSDSLPSTEATLRLIKSRRSIMPKDLSGDLLTKAEVEQVLEAANWAPSHLGTEPWRYTVVEGGEAISDYLDIIENWYNDNKEEIPEKEYAIFSAKMSGARSAWAQKVSHLVVIGMARQSLSDKKMPEWEEISAVAMSVQNLHLALTSIEGAGGFWSSHTFCKRARDSQVMRDFLGMKDKEDRVLGAFLMGKVLPGKKFRGHRRDLMEKVTWK